MGTKAAATGSSKMKHAPHYHCPNGCPKPQPIYMECRGEPTIVLCGACWFNGRGRVVMDECTPETCPDEVAVLDSSHVKSR